MALSSVKHLQRDGSWLCVAACWAGTEPLNLWPKQWSRCLEKLWKPIWVALGAKLGAYTRGPWSLKECVFFPNYSGNTWGHGTCWPGEPSDGVECSWNVGSCHRSGPVLSSPRVAPLCQKQGRVKDSTQLCQPQLKQQAWGTISHCLLVFGSWAYIFLSIFGTLLLSHVINITQCDGDTGPNNQMQHRLFLLV